VSKRRRRNLVTGLLFISPWIVGFVIFTLYPMIVSLYTSFTIYHIRAPSEWIGLANYQEMFSDRRFWRALYNTFYMVIFAVPLTLAWLISLRHFAQSETPWPVVSTD
jgi:multiple sugar transport system permease protein